VSFSDGSGFGCNYFSCRFFEFFFGLLGTRLVVYEVNQNGLNHALGLLKRPDLKRALRSRKNHPTMQVKIQSAANEGVADIYRVVHPTSEDYIEPA
jgi:hypothetical protein